MFTMIKAAERLFRAPEADKPTVLLMIDRIDGFPFSPVVR